MSSGKKGKSGAVLPGGIYAASLTPLKDDLSIDHDLLVSHCKHLLDDGCDGIALFGTTGESTSFTVAERIRTLDIIVDGGVPADRLLVGTGCTAIPDTVELTRHAVETGAGGVLVLPPFYFKNVSDAGVIASYEEVIEKVGDSRLRLYLYHFPQMSGVGLSLDTVRRLVDAYPETIVGLKDSSGNWNNLRLLCESFSDIQIFPGTEVFLLDALRHGGAGCISATFNVTSARGGELFEKWPNDDADRLQNELTAIRRIFERYPIISGLKSTLARLDANDGWLNLRVPLDRLTDSEATDLAAALEPWRIGKS